MTVINNRSENDTASRNAIAISLDHSIATLTGVQTGKKSTNIIPL